MLDQLGVTALLAQTPTVLATAIEAQMQFAPAEQPTAAPAASWHRELETQLKPSVLQQSVLRYLHERYRADTYRQVQQRLQEPLAKRARYFDLAMTQPGAEKNLRDFLAGHREEHSEAADTAARRKVLSEIDAASASSLLMATLQSALAARVHQAAAGGGIDAVLLKDEIAERQRYLAPVAADYLFYDYRYLRDDELRDYRDLLRDDAVQWLLDVSRQAILSAIVGDVTPPPGPPQ